MLWVRVGAHGVSVGNLRAGGAILSFLRFGGVLRLRARGDRAHTMIHSKAGRKSAGTIARSVRSRRADDLDCGLIRRKIFLARQDLCSSHGLRLSLHGVCRLKLAFPSSGNWHIRLRCPSGKLLVRLNGGSTYRGARICLQDSVRQGKRDRHRQVG